MTWVTSPPLPVAGNRVQLKRVAAGVGTGKIVKRK